MAPDYLAPWKEVFGEEWPEKAGIQPTKEEVELATRLGAALGKKQGLAWVLFCRNLGASREEINAACGAPQFNAAKELRDLGGADFMKAKREDGVDAYFLGQKGSRPGGPTAVPYGENPVDGPLSQADRIRAFIIEKYLKPARARGEQRVTVRSGDVHSEMGLQNAMPAVCSALDSDKLRQRAGVQLVGRDGPVNSSTVLFTFDLGVGAAPQIDRALLERLRAIFLERYADFLPGGFPASNTTSFDEEDGYKRRLISTVDAIVAETAGQADDALGEKIYGAITGKKVNLLGHFTVLDHLKQVTAQHTGALELAMGRLARDSDSVVGAAETFLDTVWPILSEGQEDSQPFTQTRMLPTLVLALVRPKDAIAIRTKPFHNALRMLLGTSGFENARFSRQEHETVLAMSHAIFEVMRDDWRWSPRDLWDVQSFIWVTCQSMLQPTAGGRSEGISEMNVINSPTNLILYGPPGTGKTYASIEEAVRLCDGAVPPSRADTEARYRNLVEAGQIAFVTFHQSYSYEDFVEGLRPTTETPDGEGTRSGFRLEPRAGLFREVCSLAQQARSRPVTAPVQLSGRSVFKMSLGRDETVYDAAIAGNYLALGWGRGEDWAGQQFEDLDEIRKRAGEIGPDAEGHPINVSQVATFRNRMRVGDLVVVPAGIRHFRAIGQVTGPYRYDPSDDHDYNHRRDVRWLLVLKDPLSVEAIYDGQFTPKACYQLSDQRLKREGLERLLSGSGKQDTSIDQFVLIIDEINRANVSKVFGELITLIEADKRIGSRRELRVKLPYSGETFGVPDNLHIVGTMNTADRSIALLDTALRRRFTFREIMPDPELLADASERSGIDLVQLLREINDRIEYLFDREHQIGHAYFIDCVSRDDVDDVMRHKVIPLISEYFYEDWGKVAQVLGDADGARRFLESIPLKAPGNGGEDSSEPRVRWVVKREFSSDAYRAP